MPKASAFESALPRCARRGDRDSQPEAEAGRDAERRDRIGTDVDDHGDPAQAEEWQGEGSERLRAEAWPRG